MSYWIDGEIRQRGVERPKGCLPVRLRMVNTGVPGWLAGPRVSEVGAVDGGGWTGFMEGDPRSEEIRRLPAGVIKQSNKRLESLFMELDRSFQKRVIQAEFNAEGKSGSGNLAR
ncbi:hypothetical protein ILYODFUR_007660 [Ilyodon furcidens]|uniref:Uncharacterized protein n=1 Tax=Ilyodon furcidens TaxID=33524 RepID=A0ABV0SWH1_9TELE